MENLNAEQVKRGLECCNTIGGCKVCPYSCNGKPTDNGECGEKMSLDALALINKQETEYNELYELCESYRKENERLFARNLDLAEKGEKVAIAYKKLSEENESIRRRMRHLFQSKFIASFDEVDRKTKEYKRNIADADKLTK